MNKKIKKCLKLLIKQFQKQLFIFYKITLIYKIYLEIKFNKLRFKIKKYK